MKHTLLKILGLTATIIAFGIAAHANTIVDLGTYGVGKFTPTVIPPTGIAGGPYLANMVTTYNGGVSGTISGELYTIVKGALTPVAPLPAAPAALLDTGVSGSPTAFTIDLGASGAGDYLVAQWDGPNGADAVYYIHGLTGLIDLTNTVDVVNHAGGAYGLSGYWVANTPPPPHVPDGGATVALLGLGLLGLLGLRRRLSRR